MTDNGVNFLHAVIFLDYQKAYEAFISKIL